MLETLRRSEAVEQLRFRDPAKAKELAQALDKVTSEVGRAPVSVMHVCGSHEQSIAKFGLRSILPKALNVINSDTVGLLTGKNTSAIVTAKKP